MAEVRFDDLEGLNALAGDFGEWGDELEVTQEIINQFAQLTGDHQWIHVDVERAKRDTPLGATIAPGFLVLSLLPRLSAGGGGGGGPTIVGYRNSVNYGAEKLRFMSPVPAGAKVHARGRLVRAEARPKGTLVTTEQELTVVGADRPSLLYAMQGLYMGG